MQLRDSSLLALVVCYVSAAATSVGGSVLLLQGQLESEALLTEQSVRYNFVALVEETKARITVSRISQGKDVEEVEYYSDGSVSRTCVANGEPAKFRVATVRQSDAKEELRAEPITGDIKHDTVATLTVNPTPVPDYHFGLSAIWLAVYGGSYYRSHAQEATDPVFPVGESYAAGLTVLHQGVNVSSKSKVQQIEPFFLIELTEFQPDKLIRLQGNRLIRQGWPKDFKGKVVNAEYKVLSWMDVAGHQIPQTFQAQKYLPNIAAGSGGALSLVTRFTGTITNAQFISTNVSSGIDVPAPTRIIENRLPVPGFVYISPDGRLRNLKEVSALDDYKRRLRSFQPSIASRTRIFIYIVLLAAAVFPIILWKKQTRSARPTGNNK